MTKLLDAMQTVDALVKRDPSDPLKAPYDLPNAIGMAVDVHKLNENEAKSLRRMMTEKYGGGGA